MTFNCASGHYFHVTLGAASGGVRSIAAPSNVSGGYRLIYHFRQGASGNIGVTFAAKYRFGQGVPAPIVLSPTLGYSDKIGVVYDSADDRLDVVSLAPGFPP